jgi:hypothetical protein
LNIYFLLTKASKIAEGTVYCECYCLRLRIFTTEIIILCSLRISCREFKSNL